MAKLAEVTIVNIKMNQHNALVLTKYSNPTFVPAISTIGKTLTKKRLCITLLNSIFLAGSIMSMYYGYSFLNLLEIVFWAMKGIKVVTWG